MKKILYSVMAIAALTFSFTSLTSCEDVPAPYEIPGEDTPDTPAAEPAGTGTQADPFNVAGALKYIENGGDENTEVYVKGKVVSVVSGSYDASYGSLKYYISDDGTETNQFYVFNGYAGPNRTKFSGEDALKAGDEVVICGKLVTFNGTKEFTTGNYVVSINGNGGGSDQPATGDNDGTEEKPYTAKEAIAKGTATNVFVKAYIVGCVNDKALSSASFDASNFTSETNILVAASVDEKDVNNCLPVQLPSGKVREGLNLKANASNYKKEVLLYGNIEKYFGAVGIKSVTYAKVGDKEFGAKPSGSAGGDTPSGSEILNESFASGIGTFTIKDVTLSDGLTYVWKHDDYKYMKASAFAGSAKASESWLVSGKLDLSKVKDATLTFDQALNHLKSQNRADYVNVLVSTDFSGDVTKAKWTELTVEGWPTTDSWTIVSSKASMKAFAGKSNVYIAFKYTSNTSYAPTWEIKNVVIK